MNSKTSSEGERGERPAEPRPSRYSPKPVFTHPSIRIEIDERSNATPYGGLALYHTLVGQLGLPNDLRRELMLLKVPLPYWESDHVLTHVYNLLCGGTCIEDIANLQNSEAVKRMLGTDVIPDPTTAGDFLRRFKEGDLEGFQRAIDAARVRVWKKMPRELRERATIDLDSHVREMSGDCKQGADFSYTGKWSYHPLLAKLAETGECLRSVNRPGNKTSADGAEKMLRESLQLTRGYFKERIWRGDTAFYECRLINLTEEEQAYFVVCVDAMPNVVGLAQKLPEAAWKPMKWDSEKKVIPKEKQRRKRINYRNLKAKEREYKNIEPQEQGVAEFEYQPTDCKKPYRMIVRRVKIRETKGQQLLFEGYRYYFMLTNLWRGSAERIVRFGYKRSDIENDIEQMENGIEAMKMPTGELLANGAFLMMGQLAWNLKAWSALLLLPKETRVWEWKRFRYALIYIGAKVIRQGRRIVAKISHAHRYAEAMFRAMNRAAALNLT